MPPNLRIPKHQRQSTSHFRARNQEREKVEKLQGAKLVPRSGAGDVKADVRIKGFVRIECKTTKHKSFAITREILRKIEEAGLSAGECPILVVEFTDEKGKPENECCVLPKWALEAISQQWRDL